MTTLLKEITWPQFFAIMGIMFILYYFIVGLIYFRKDIGTLFSRGDDGQTAEQTAWDEESPASDLSTDLESTVNDIAHRILVPGNRATKDELLDQLKISVANFGGLSRPGYRYALNNFIIEKAKENCGTAFSEDELNEVWNSLSRQEASKAVE